MSNLLHGPISSNQILHVTFCISELMVMMVAMMMMVMVMMMISGGK